MKVWLDKIKQNAFVQHFMATWGRVNLPIQASSIAFFALLALAPMVLAIANLIPLLPIPTQEVLPYLELALPGDIYGIIEPILSSYLNQSTGGALSISILVTLWPATKGLGALQNVINEVYGAKPRSNVIFARVLSFLFGLAVAAAIALVSFLFVFGDVIVDFLRETFDINFQLLTDFSIMKWIGTILVMFTASLLIYLLLPNVKWPFNYALPGSAFLTVCFLAISQLFSLYVSFFGSSLGLGTLSIGAFMVLMMWLYFVAISIILGGFINVFIYRLYYPEDKTQKPLLAEKEED